MTEIQKSRRSRGLKSMSVATVASASVIGLVLGTGTASAGVDGAVTIVDADGNSINVVLSDTFINGVPSLDGNPLTREWFADGKASWTVTGPTADDFEGDLYLGYQVGYPASIGGELTIAWGSPDVTFGIGSTNESTVTGGTGIEYAPGTVDGRIPNPAYDEEIAEATKAAILAALAAGTTPPPPYTVPPTIPGPVTNPDAGTPSVSPPTVDLEGVGGSNSALDFEAQLIPKADITVGIKPGPGIAQAQSEALPVGGDDGIQGANNEGSGTSGSVQVAGVHGQVTGALGNVSVRPFAALTSATGDTAVAYGQPVRFN